MILFPFRQNSFSDETAKKDNYELDQEYNLFDTPPINLQRKMINKRKRGTKFKANISQSVVEYFLKVDNIVFWSGCTWLYGWSGAVGSAAPNASQLSFADHHNQASLSSISWSYFDNIIIIIKPSCQPALWRSEQFW